MRKYVYRNITSQYVYTCWMKWLVLTHAVQHYLL